MSLNFRRIAEKGLLVCVEALLAHEIGHHVRWPRTLAVDARLQLLEWSLIPLKGYSVINLFTDLLINERLTAAYADRFAKVDRAFADDAADGWERDPAFLL